MLLVKTRLGQSPIEGTGLFAAEPIKAGTVTWRFLSGFDQAFTAEQIAGLPRVARETIETYTYLHQPSGLYVYCLDNARFMNHADDPNTAGVHAGGAIEGYDIATRDIAEGEELTCDYRLFDASFAKKLGIPAD
jgi:SET domain-containing protein